MSQHLPDRPQRPVHGVCFALTVAATLVLASTALLGSGAWAASATGSIHVGAAVPTVCTVAVSDSNATLDLVNGQNALTVGSVTEQCNAGNGYTVSVSSANSGTLRSSGTGTSAVAYSLSYDQTTAGKNGALSTDRAASPQGRQSNLAVSLPGNAQAAAGQYQDTVTISIAAK
ncbi:spore coat protein U domain-containing protein [Nitrospirillum iridis]|uniref:Spore coat protein U/FanG domain-containing protein n=1 Tax=Nitrospirillum iridis TaxID=765888 RepID=A0A7X0B331_9PROT|nr:spore coat protein U domain-containing protein [Nitrospirillum iridis]MBB6254812.1 hypothetical protein [Nitrospirillum iridis]